MPTEPQPASESGVRLQLATVAELQDQLLSAATELDRLIHLIDDAAGQLVSSFAGASFRLGEAAPDPEAIAAARDDVKRALVAMQFHDMANQLITHANRRVRSVADYLAGCEPGDDAIPVELVRRSSPVAQREMDAGSIELF